MTLFLTETERRQWREGGGGEGDARNESGPCCRMEGGFGSVG